MKKTFLTLLAFCCLAGVFAQNITTQEYTVQNGEISLPGTFLAPGSKDFPVVVFVHGSGPNNRDETLGPNNVFKQMAEGLAKHGIGSLRYDKRTMLYKQGGDTLTYYGETILDAAEAAKQLHAQGYKHVYIAGHSLGGHVAPLIAKEAKGVIDGIVILSGNVTSIDKAIEAQLKYIGKQQGATDEQINQLIQQMLSTIPTRYLEFARGYQPVNTLRQVLAEQPALRWMVVQGGHDYQVTIADYIMWQMAFADKATFYYDETLDHIYRSLPEMATPESYLQPGTMDKNVIKAIANFILKAE